MLMIKDSVKFSRTSAAVSLVLGGLCFVAASLVEPAWAPDERAYLAEIAAAPNRYQASAVLNELGSTGACSAWSAYCTCCVDGESLSASSAPGW